MATNNSINSLNPIQVALGGTGAATLTAHGVLVGEGTSAVTALSAATTGQVLIGSTGADPAFGSIGVNSGLTVHGVLLAENNSAFVATTAGTNGQVFLGSTGADPVFATLTSSDSSVTFTTGAGTLSIQVANPIGPWTDVTGTSVTLAANNSYILDNAGLVTATLPTTATVGNTFTIVGKGTGGWKIAQNASQLIHFGTTTTTTGTGGSLASTQTFDCITLVCTVTNTTFTAYTSVGNITVV